MNRLFPILALLLLACVATLPQPAAISAPVPVRSESDVVQMVVTAEKAVNIRANHTEHSAGLGTLLNGEVVEVFNILAVGDGNWCQIVQGWVNCRYLEAK